MALRQLLGIRHGIELHVAKHPADLHAQLAQACAHLLGLGPDGCDR
jgi:hypothetical protein